VTDNLRCPFPATKGNRCDEHAQAYENRRGSRQERGYDAKHVAARAEGAPAVLAGLVNCWRCGELIGPGEEWDLGHLDDGRIGGPEHAGRCNRRAAALKGHGKEWAPEKGREGSPAAHPAPLAPELSRLRAESQERAARAAQRRTEREARRNDEQGE
jgi:hypothetical protein